MVRHEQQNGCCSLRNMMTLFLLAGAGHSSCDAWLISTPYHSTPPYHHTTAIEAAARQQTSAVRMSWAVKFASSSSHARTARWKTASRLGMSSSSTETEKTTIDQAERVIDFELDRESQGVSNRVVNQQQQQPFHYWTQGVTNLFADEGMKKWVAGIAVAASLLSGFVMGPLPSYATDSKAVFFCLVKNCKKELAQCLLDPVCFANIICLNTCNNRPDEVECQVKCGDTFESKAIGTFNTCAVSQKKCVPQKPDDGSYPVPSDDALVKEFDPKLFEGQWYITAGLNKAFDTFDCQAHFFAVPAPGKLFAKINWRVTEPDGEFFSRNTIQQFVQRTDNPAILENHGNEFLHYQDDWYILDYEPNEFILVYYRGQNDAWVGYGGAVVYTKSSTFPEKITARVDKALAKIDRKFSDFELTDNTCDEPTKSTLALRGEFANKLLMQEEDELQREITNLRGFGAKQVIETEKGAAKALQRLEDLTAAFEKTLEKDIVEVEEAVEKEIVKDVVKVEKEIEKDLKTVEEEVKEVGSVIDTDIWKATNARKLDDLQKRLQI